MTSAQIAKDFGIHEMTLSNWMRQADFDNGDKPGRSRAQAAENPVLSKRVRVLEPENEVLRRAAAYYIQSAAAGAVQ